MSYQKQSWEDRPSTSTPISAARLSHMEQGIYDAYDSGGDILSIGTILPFSGDDESVPTGWTVCDGKALSRTGYPELFELIGTTYGSGNGTSTFNIPNLKGKTPVGQDTNDTSFDVLGETGGEKTHTLVSSEMPSHTHTQKSCTNPGDHSHKMYSGYITYQGGSATGNSPATANPDWGGDQWTQGAGGHTHTITLNNTGGDGAHNNLQPYIVINYIIKISPTSSVPATGQIVNTIDASSGNAYSTNFLNNYTPNMKVLWTNSAPTSSFAAQTISLDETLDNYDSYEILFLQGTTVARIMSTGFVPVGNGTILNYVVGYPKYRPTGASVSGTTISFEDCKSLAAFGSGTTENTSIIPMYVIGRRTGLFD